MGQVCKKIISIILIMTLLISSNGEIFAQIMSDISAYQPMYNDIRGLMSAEMREQLNEGEETIGIKNKFRQAHYNFAEIWDELDKQIQGSTRASKIMSARSEGEAKGILEEVHNAEVCIDIGKYYERATSERICAPYRQMAEGLVGAWLEGAGTLDLNKYSIPRLKEGMERGLIGRGDRSKIRGLIYNKPEINELIGNCDVKEEDIPSLRRCERGLDIAEILVASSMDSEEEKAEAGEYIYKHILKKSIKGRPYSAMLLTSGVGLLVALDTDNSYKLLEEFLTDYSIPTVVGGAIDDYEGVISIQGIYQIGEDAIGLVSKDNAQRYLNKYNKRWQYIDEGFSKKLGVGSYVIKNERLMFDNRSRLDEEYYNIAYGNLLTDIGKYLPKQGERGKALSKKIINKRTKHK